MLLEFFFVFGKKRSSNARLIIFELSCYHQVAGCTLDAGAKIYAGRVDAIYNDVYKMLGGFGRTNKQDKGMHSYSNKTQ